MFYKIEDYRILAASRLPKMSLDYFNGGANDMVSLNSKSFDQLKLKTRIFNSSEECDLKCDFLGQQVDSPICVASTAFQMMAHPDGELAVANACNLTKTPFALSSNSNTAMEEFKDHTTAKVYQIYMSKDPAVNSDMWLRAKCSGFEGFALTCDTQLLGKRLNDVRNRFKLPSHLGIANYEKYKTSTLEESKGSALAHFMNNQKDN